VLYQTAVAGSTSFVTKGSAMAGKTGHGEAGIFSMWIFVHVLSSSRYENSANPLQRF